MVSKRKRRYANKTDTLCWSCKKSTNDFLGCPWCQRLEPVPGWVAEEREWRHPLKETFVIDKTYVVKECPLFLEG